MTRFASPAIVNIADLREAARRRLPNAVFDYLEGTADDGVTGADNIASFGEVTFRPRQAVTVTPDTSTTILGVKLGLPLLLSPIGYCRLLHPAGDPAVARAAKRADTGYILATGAGYGLDDVAPHNDRLFFQVYQMGGRAAAERALARARALGVRGIFVTVDTPVGGNRERDPKNGMAALMAPRLLPKLRYAPEVMAHPRWLLRFLLDGGVPSMPNVTAEDGSALPAPDVAGALARANICWTDLPWIRKAWDGPMVVKGILRPDDARRAVDEGADGVVVSNHGGRQLDTVAASLRALPPIVDAVKGKTAIFMDGGIRRGSDIAKAICLGADAVLVARAYAYGLAAGGEAGVDRALEILRNDLVRTMKLLGAATVTDLTGALVAVKPGFEVS
jgi:isopentenyl diphosphate isomerase/L-lactate dehydrogenase-like FMN-dependent dehydrogenase